MDDKNIQVSTKFSIGDTVYYIDCEQIKKTTISKIILHLTISKSKTGELVYDKYLRYILTTVMCDDDNSFTENELFSSHEDFVKHLKSIDMTYENS